MVTPDQLVIRGRKKPKWFLRRRVLVPAALLIGVGVGSAGDGTDPVSQGSLAGQVAEKKTRTKTVTDPVATQPAAKAVAGPAEPANDGPGIGDTVRDGKLSFKVTRVRKGVESVGSDFLGKKAQGQFILVTLKVKNIGDKAQSLAGDAQKIYDAKGRKYSADTEAAIYVDESNSL